MRASFQASCSSNRQLFPLPNNDHTGLDNLNSIVAARLRKSGPVVKHGAHDSSPLIWAHRLAGLERSSLTRCSRGVKQDGVPRRPF